MKRLLFLAILFMFVSSAGAVTLKYDTIELRHDDLRGTFVSKKTRFGYVVGANYEVHYVVKKRTIRYVGSISFSPALKKFPTVTAVKAKIVADFKAKNVENRANQFPFAGVPNLTLKD